MEGSSHSYQRALHCFGVLRTSSDDIRALEAWFTSFAVTVYVKDVPLVLAILGNSSLEHLVLRVLFKLINAIRLSATTRITYLPNTYERDVRITPTSSKLALTHLL